MYTLHTYTNTYIHAGGHLWAVAQGHFLQRGHRVAPHSGPNPNPNYSLSLLSHLYLTLTLTLNKLTLTLTLTSYAAIRV